MRWLPVLSLALMAGIFPLRQAQSSQEVLAPPTDKRPAAEVYKNILVYRDMPADQLVTTMKGFTQSLGVRCEFCHVTAEGSKIPGFGAFSKDDMPTKRTARDMIRMVQAINGASYLPTGASVSCWTCHRGATKPPNTPPAAGG